MVESAADSFKSYYFYLKNRVPYTIYVYICIVINHCGSHDWCLVDDSRQVFGAFHHSMQNGHKHTHTHTGVCTYCASCPIKCPALSFMYHHLQGDRLHTPIMSNYYLHLTDNLIYGPLMNSSKIYVWCSCVLDNKYANFVVFFGRFSEKRIS